MIDIKLASGDILPYQGNDFTCDMPSPNPFDEVHWKFICGIDDTLGAGTRISDDYYVDQCYTVAFDEEEGYWYCSIWALDSNGECFDDIRAINCENSEEAYEELLISLDAIAAHNMTVPF